MTMPETWLRPNARALWFGMVPGLILWMLGVWMAFGLEGIAGGWLGWLGQLLIGLAMIPIGVLLYQLRKPRIGYADRQVSFYLRSGPPISVPVEVVESFFLGQGPTLLPGQQESGEKTANLVARLSQRETQWAQVDVKPALGQWQDGYVTIRGTWCEPLSIDLVRSLNQKLSQVKKATCSL